MNLSRPQTNPSPSLWEKLYFIKWVPHAKKVRDCCLISLKESEFFFLFVFFFFPDPKELWWVKLLDTLREMSGMFSQWLLLADLIFACSKNNNCGHANILSQDEETADRVRGKCILTLFLWLILFMWPVANLNLISVRWLRKFQLQERVPGDDAIFRALQWCLWSGPSLIFVTCC